MYHPLKTKSTETARDILNMQMEEHILCEHILSQVYYVVLVQGLEIEL